MKLYKILGIKEDATLDEIKLSYKQLALQCHPDKNKQDPSANSKFSEISKAYKILKDSDKRAAYDKLGDQYEDDDINDPFSIFKEMYESADQVPNVDVIVELSTEDLYHGCTVNKSFERYSLCKQCRGKGTDDGCEHLCKFCKGNGSTLIEIDDSEELEFAPSACTKCEGNGIDHNVKLCKKCKGDTCYKENITLSVDIPAGACMGYVVTMDNKGNEIPRIERNKKSKRRSGVNFIVDEIKNDYFRRGLIFPSLNRASKSDLMYELIVTFPESVCGFSKTITHLSGKNIHVIYKEPILNGEYIVLKNKGMPVPNSDMYGDLFIKIKVDRPQLDKAIKNRIWQILMKEPYSNVTEMLQTKDLVHFDEFETDILNNKSCYYSPSKSNLDYGL